MKKTVIAVVTFISMVFLSNQAISGEREIIGALIGAGSGAIIGHAVVGSPEAVVLGTALGGVLGVSATQIHRRGIPVPFPPFFVEPPRRVQRYNGEVQHYNGEQRYRRPNYRNHHYNGSDCRIVQHYRYKHGHRYSIKKRICRDEGPSRHWNRGYNHDRYLYRQY